MENNPYSITKPDNNVYNYSKKYIPYKFLSKLGIIVSPQKLSEYSALLGINIFFGILVYFLIEIFKAYPDKSPFFIVFLILVALSTTLCGLKSAFLTTAIITFETYFIFGITYNNSLNIPLYIQLVFFSIGAIGISIAIYLVKENSEVKKLKKQEKTYALAFTQLQDEHNIALKDIQARDQFLSIVSHELKTPLTIMLLKLHAMKNDMENISLANFSIQQLMKVLENSEEQIKWLKIIINDLLDVSLITTGRMNLQLEETDLVAITKQVKQSFSEVLKKEKCKIEIHANSPVVGKWDKGRIEQSITNLISNAIKYGEGKPITISIVKSADTGKFIIKDQGNGIPKQEQKAIFDLFKRASGSGKYKKGLGVGLFITYQIVTMHGGKIKVSSVPKGGTTFTIELPMQKA